MNSESSLYLDEQHSEMPDSLAIDGLSIALIGPDDDRRKAAATALASSQGGEIREFAAYPSSLDDVPKLLDQQFDVIVIDLDSRSEYALDLVENICSNSPATVMVYSEKSDSNLLMRCMRAGAREFLSLPFAQNTLVEALARAAARRPARPVAAKKAGGRLLVFLGAKGGDGVTTLACNFAVSLAQESTQSTLLIDLDLPLGDAALNLGVIAEYSAINALQNAARLDAAFLSKLLVKHSSGVSVLAAPGKFPQYDAGNDAVDKLIAVARQEFDNVVIDMGSRLDLMGTSLFKDGSTVYLVIQAGIAGLRNSNRLISQYFSTNVPKLEIVLNRYEPRSLGVNEDQITKALTRPAQWKIPNDYNAVRRMQTTAIPLALEDSPISRLIRQMSRTACGLPPAPEKRSGENGSGFSLKNLRRSITGRSSQQEEPQNGSQLGSSNSTESAAQARGAAQTEEEVAISPAYSSQSYPAERQPVAEAQEPTITTAVSPQTEAATVTYEEHSAVSAASQPAEPETRIYRGATYVKGPDGKWHLQAALASAAKKVDEAEAANRETPIIDWPSPAPLVFGHPLGVAQLNATASVPGSFVYSHAAGDHLAVGEHTLSVAFTPEDTARYTATQEEVSLAVVKATPTVAWSTPAPITYGTVLGAAQLNAMASVPGVFAYTPAAGTLPTAGVQTLLVTFTPEDGESYETAQATVSLTINKAIPSINWHEPSPVICGEPLGAAQLNATASVPGRITYTPAADALLTAGVHTLTATFTPASPADYTTVQASVRLTVAKAAPVIQWQAPAPITYGAALSAMQLNAKASVPGVFVYSPAPGEVLKGGTHTLSAKFTPNDGANHNTVEKSVLLTVAKATPIVTWPPIEAMVAGTDLNGAQLNATALVPGTFVYSPAAGELLAAGEHTLSVVFHPADSASYTTVQSTAQLTVVQPKPAAVSVPIVPATPTEQLPIPAEQIPVAKEAAVPEAKTHAAPEAEAHARQFAEAPAKALVKLPQPKFTIDAASGMDLMGTAVFPDGTTIYLVMQPGSGGQQDSKRLVAQFLAGGDVKPEIAINRVEARTLDVGDDSASTALTRSAYSPISRLIGQMAEPAPEPPAPPVKKKFSLRGLRRSLWSRVSSSEKQTGFTNLGLNSNDEETAVQRVAPQPVYAANLPVQSVYATPAREQMQPRHAPAYAAESAEIRRATPQSVPTPAAHEPETRIYQGNTYVKGVDGKWHLLQLPVRPVTPLSAPANAPVAQGPKPSSEQFLAQFKPAQAVAGKTAAPAKAAAKKTPAKTGKKPPVKSGKAASPAKKAAKRATAKPGGKAAKVVAKATAKKSVKSVNKPKAQAGNSQAKAKPNASAKTIANKTVKASVKSKANSSPNRQVKTAVKPKAVAKPKTKAPALKSLPVKMNSAAVPQPMPAVAVPPSPAAAIVAPAL